MAQVRQKATTQHAPGPQARCLDCHALFPDHDALDQHMVRESRHSNWATHVHCDECKKYMPSLDALKAHLKRNHPIDQNLNCPACGKHFVRVTEVARHVEQNECPRLDVAKLYLLHDKKLAFARELHARHRGDYDAEVEATYMSRNSALRPKAETTVRPYPLQFQPFETDQVDTFWYHQNVIDARRAARVKDTSQQSSVARQDPASETIRVTETTRAASQLFNGGDPAPTDTGEWKHATPRTGDSLLDDFDPIQNQKLQPSLIDYYDPGNESVSGCHDPCSAYFNPWGNDDLIGMSSAASSRSSSPAGSRLSASLGQGATDTDRDKSPTPTVVTLDDSVTTTTVPAALPNDRDARTVTAKATRVLPLVEVPEVVAFGRGRHASTTPVQKLLLPSAPTASTQFWMPAGGSSAVAPFGMENIPPEHDYDQLDDYDEVRQIIANELARHNPKSPGFRVQDYFDLRIRKYKCPISQCFKSFKTAGSFQHHVGTHMVGRKLKYPCPGCKDMFDSIAALVAHTESQSIRCQFRHSKNYGTFLSQALAGMVDVVGEDMVRGTVWFAISKDAKKEFGDSTPDNATARRSRSDESKAATAALEDQGLDKDAKAREMWAEHEREVEARIAHEKEQQQILPAKTREVEEFKRQQAERALGQMVDSKHNQQTGIKQDSQSYQTGHPLARAGNSYQAIENEKTAKEAETETQGDRARKTGERGDRQADKDGFSAVWNAQKQHAQQIRLARERKIGQHKANEADSQTKNQQERNIISQKHKELEDEELALLQQIEKVRELRWKLQQAEQWHA